MKSLLLLLASMLPLVVHTQTPDSQLQTTLDSFRQAYRVPAISASVIYQDEIRYAWSGAKSMENEEPIDASSKFQLSSNTKAITATIAAHLVEKEIVDWQVTLVEALPELVDDIIPAYQQVTLHYGFPNYALGWYNGQIGDTEQRFSYHGGSLGTFSSAVILSADRQVAIVILINADGKQVTRLKTELRKALWEQYGRKY